MKKLSIKEAKQELEQQGLRLLKHRYAMLELPMEDILWMIEPSDLAAKYVDFYKKYPKFQEVPAGARHHHWWKGGLEEHVKEMIGVGFDLMELYAGDLTGFTRSDVIIACFLHDFAKVWAYVPVNDEDRAKHPDRYLPGQEFRLNRDQFKILDDENKTLVALAQMGLPVTEKQWSAVIFSEGGFSKAHFSFQGRTDTSGTVNSNNPLAVIMHMLDLYSSQILGKSLYGQQEEANVTPKEEAAAQ